MKRVIHYAIKLHSCHLLYDLGVVEEKDATLLDRYVCTKNEPVEDADDNYLNKLKPAPEFYRMKQKCTCRKWITLFQAIDMVECGQAKWVSRVNKGRFEKCSPDSPKDIGHIWRPVVREKVPRIDLISRADVQRAYGLKNEKVTPRQKEFRDYIEAVNRITQEERIKLLAPFRPDPFEGRAVVINFNDERSMKIAFDN